MLKDGGPLKSPHPVMIRLFAGILLGDGPSIFQYRQFGHRRCFRPGIFLIAHCTYIGMCDILMCNTSIHSLCHQEIMPEGMHACISHLFVMYCAHSLLARTQLVYPRISGETS